MQNPFEDLIPKAAPVAQQAAAMPSNPFADLIPQNQISTAGAALTGFNSMAGNFAHGALQPLLESGFLGDSIAQSSKNVALRRQQEFAQAEKQHPIATNIGGVAGGIAATSPTMGIGGGATALGKAASLVGGGALTGAQAYVNEGDSRLQNAFTGAIAAPITYGALKAAGYLAAKPINAVKNNLKEGAQALINLGKKYAVPIFASDVSKSGMLNRLAQGLENVPIIGIKGERQAQMNAAKNAAENFVSQAKSSLDNISFGGKTGITQLQKIAQGGGARAQAAQNLLNQIQNSGDDWNKILQTSGNLKLFRSKLIADEKYGRVSQLADQFGAVPKTNALRSIDNAIIKAKESILPDNGLINTLNTIKTNLSSKDLNYSQMRQARSDIGGLLDGYFQGGNAAIGKKGAELLTPIRNAIGQDMDQFAQTANPALKTAWKNADRFYRQNVTPFKDSQLANAVKNADADEVYAKFIKAGDIEGGKGTGRATRFYNALDNKGKAAVRYGMISNAFEKAYKGDSNMFSPARFAAELDKVAAAKGVFFKGAEKAEIDGFKNLMRHTDRSFIALSKPETGVQNIPYLIGGGAAAGAIFNPAATATGLAGTYAMKKLLTTNSGRRLLLASSKLAPNSPQMQAFLDKSRQLIQRIVAIEATNPELKEQDNVS